MNAQNTDIKKTFQLALEAYHLHHAYLFLKHDPLLLEDVVLMLFCQNKINGAGCGICHACEAVKRRVHPDLFWADEKEKHLKIDTVREAIAFAALSTHAAQYRVIVLPLVQRLAIPAANALLKTLEEPSSRVIFLLTTSAPSQLPITLMSRCHKIRLSSQPGMQMPAFYPEFEKTFSDLSEPVDVIALMDEMNLSIDECLHAFMYLTVAEVKKRCHLGQSSYHLFNFYKKLLNKKRAFLKSPQLNAELLSYDLACEWKKEFKNVH